MNASDLLRRWPWWTSICAWVVVARALTLARRDVSGIQGFSSSNYGWLAFTAVGGCVLAWRPAGAPPWYWLLARPLIVGAAAYLMCVAAVALMGVIFLPSRPLQGGGDGIGPLGGALRPLVRAQVVGIVVVGFGCVVEVLRLLWDGRRRPPEGTLTGRDGAAPTAP